MKRQLLISLIFAFSIATSCNQKTNSQVSEVHVWKLGWRMIESSMEADYQIADLQFDSLLRLSDNIETNFLVTGLDVKSKLEQFDAIIEILNTQDEETLRKICVKQFLKNLNPCLGFSNDKVENPALQLELIKMYVDDQAARGNMKDDIISKFNLDKSQVNNDDPIAIDERNRSRLKEIFEEYGFPTGDLVGKDAMQGIFLMIQHADGDKEWQKLQLQNIKKAVKRGDMNGQSYAYLYDRIRINSGEKQLYGTQFARVDPVNKTVELAETEDIENLDERRREIGMMPIEMYRSFMLKNL